MRTSFAASVLVLVLAVAACGGTVDIGNDSSGASGNGPGGGSTSAGGAAGGGGGGGTTTTPDPLGLAGSYDLRFTSVVPSWGPGSGPPGIGPASLTQIGRVDLRKNADGTYDAIVTGRWGIP